MYALALRHSATSVRSSDWSGAIAEAQRVQQSNESVWDALEATGAEIARFVETMREQAGVLSQRIEAMRPMAEAADAAYMDLEDAYYGSDDTPPELIEIIDNTACGLMDALDEIEAQLSDAGLV